MDVERMAAEVVIVAWLFNGPERPFLRGPQGQSNRFAVG